MFARVMRPDVGRPAVMAVALLLSVVALSGGIRPAFASVNYGQYNTGNGTSTVSCTTSVVSAANMPWVAGFGNADAHDNSAVEASGNKLGTPSDLTDPLVCLGYGLALTFPLGITIDGIEVYVVAGSEKGKDSIRGASVSLHSGLAILVAGTSADTTTNANFLPVDAQESFNCPSNCKTYGSNISLWGAASIDPSNLGGEDFGVALVLSGADGGTDDPGKAHLDYITPRVFWSVYNVTATGMTPTSASTRGGTTLRFSGTNLVDLSAAKPSIVGAELTCRFNRTGKFEFQTGTWIDISNATCPSPTSFGEGDVAVELSLDGITYIDNVFTLNLVAPVTTAAPASTTAPTTATPAGNTAPTTGTPVGTTALTTAQPSASPASTTGFLAAASTGPGSTANAVVSTTGDSALSSSGIFVGSSSTAPVPSTPTTTEFSTGSSTFTTGIPSTATATTGASVQVADESSSSSNLLILILVVVVVVCCSLVVLALVVWKRRQSSASSGESLARYSGSDSSATASDDVVVYDNVKAIRDAASSAESSTAGSSEVVYADVKGIFNEA